MQLCDENKDVYIVRLEIIICPTLHYLPKIKSKLVFGDSGIVYQGAPQRFLYDLAHKMRTEQTPADANKQAEDMFFRLIKQMTEREGMAEKT